MAGNAFGRRWVAMLCGAAVAAACPCDATQAASILDRLGRFAIQWWTIDDGLPEAPVNGVAIAPDGSVVCASASRISWFDGVTFRPLPQSLTDPLHERIGSFWNIGFDADGRLWVQGMHAAAVLEVGSHDGGKRRRWKIHTYSRGTLTSLTFTAAGRPVLVGPDVVLVEDGPRFVEAAVAAPDDRGVQWRFGDIDPHSGTLWLWGDTHRRSALRRAEVPASSFRRLLVEDDLTPGGDVISMGFGTGGPVALLPDCGAVRRDADWQRLPPILPNADYRKSGKVAQSSDGTVWISSHNGILACRNGVAETVTDGLPGFSLLTGALVTDDTGGIWAACAGGLLAVRRTRLSVEPITDCRAAFERPDGSLLIGSPGGISTHPSIGGAAAEAPQPLATPGVASVPTAILEDRAGRIWVGTQDNFILRIEDGRVRQITKPAEHYRELRNIYALACDAQGRVWAATANGLAYCDPVTDAFRTVTPDDHTAQPVVIGLAAERDGSILAAIQSRGVERVSADGKRTQIITAAELPGRRTIVFRRDSRGTLWIGGDRGLVRVASDEAVFHLTTATGLADDAIRQIDEDRQGRLWIATRGGHIQGMRLDDLEALAAGRLSVVQGVVLGPLDGIGDADCIGHMARWPDPADAGGLDRITVPLSTGVLRFDPGEIAAARTSAPPPTVTRDAAEAFAFRYASPGIHWGRPPLHQTRLAGVDTGWSSPTTDAQRAYASLPPGRHVFQVRTLAGETDRDFPVTTLGVSVPAPWWRQPVTVAVLAAMLATAAAMAAREITRRRTRRLIAKLEWQRAMDRERARIARDIHDGLGAGLTRMAMMSDLARKGGSTRGDLSDRLDAIYRNARSLTRSVDEIVWAVNPRNDTVAQFISYVVQDVEEFVHAGDVTLRLDVPDGPPDERPLATHVRHHVCLAVREALQNVLRHADATHVDFAIHLTPGTMTVRIRDDGVGFSTDLPSGPEQDGLHNMQDRVAEVGGEVTVESTPRGGTCVTLAVPLSFLPEPAGVTLGRERRPHES
jgi:signal transduction histidine kinase